jgi:hypothetical protein
LVSFFAVVDSPKAAVGSTPPPTIANAAATVIARRPKIFLISLSPGVNTNVATRDDRHL